MPRETMGQTDHRLFKNTQRGAKSGVPRAKTETQRPTINGRKRVVGTDNKFPPKKS